MRAEMSFVRGIDLFFLQIDQRTNGFDMMFRNDSGQTAGASHEGLWSMVDLGTLVDLVPLAWRTLVFG